MPIAAHERISKDGTSDVWLTPQWVIFAIGPFDLDPCAAPSPRPWSTAARHIELPDDGLGEAWQGRVWLNPPYSDASPWLERMAKHGSGIALIFARTETEAWQQWVWPYADAVMFPAGRIAFCLPDGTKKSGAGAPSAFVSYSALDTVRLLESGIRGAMVTKLAVGRHHTAGRCQPATDRHHPI